MEAHMNHQYKVDISVNHAWCSFLDGNKASVRKDDLQSKELMRIHASPKFQDNELYYKFNVKMEHVE